MRSHYLTKSDFKAARSCPTKLYYRHLDYPATSESNEFLTVLAEQGYLVEALARRRYPKGRWLNSSGSVEMQAQDSAEVLQLMDEVTLFEATIISQGKLARLDILVKQGNTFRLIEIKSCGLDVGEEKEVVNNAFWTSRGTPQIRPGWRPYLEDVTFQWQVLTEQYPEAVIIPYLLVLDSSKPCSLDHLQQLQNSAADSAWPVKFEDLDFLIEVDVSYEVSTLLPEIKASTAGFLGSLQPHLLRHEPILSTQCRDCEYRVSTLERNGFRECWGTMADTKPHILDLFSVGTIGGSKGKLADELIAQGKSSLYDIPLEALTKADGTIGTQATRQLRQIRQTQLNQEWLDPALGQALAGLAYPLHFIDFETCSPTVPRYAGMRPFETIAFQWSCHTIHEPGAAVVHSDWLQSEDYFPNVHFAEALREQLGDSGAILIWSSHEQTVLKSIGKRLNMESAQHSRLAQWLVEAVSRLVDLYQLTTRYYFHPLMGGKASVKAVCEAVWNEDEGLRDQYPEFQSDSSSHSPYRSLPPLVVDGEETIVRNGTGAIIAYMQIMGDNGSISSEDQQQWRRLLRQYCRLDTLAMVMIWEHWQHTLA